MVYPLSNSTHSKIDCPYRWLANINHNISISPKYTLTCEAYGTAYKA